MNLPQSGVLDLNWSANTGVSGYKIEISNKGYINETFIINDNSVNSFSFTGFKEGDSGDGRVFAFQQIRGHKVFEQTGFYSNSKFFYPENFNITSGESFHFTGIKINNELLDSTFYPADILQADASFQLPTSPNSGIDFNFIDPKPKIIGLNTTAKVTSGQLYEVDRARFTSSTGTVTSIRINEADNLNIAYRGVNWEMASVSQSGGLFATGTTSRNSFNLSYELISPRSGNLIENYQEFFDEPFAKSISGYITDDLGYRFNMPNIESNTISHVYTGISKNFDVYLFSEDFYNVPSTGIIQINNQPVSVLDLSVNKTTFSGSGLLNFFPSYSRDITGAHIFLYSDEALSTLEETKFASDSSNVYCYVPLNTDRYIKIIPYTNFGSGNHFTDLSNYGVFQNSDPLINSSEITLLDSSEVSGSQFARINCYTNLTSYSGHHLDLSIYTGINNSSNQYFSGSFNDDISFLFDVTGSRSGKESIFNVDCLLYESGNLTAIDSGNLSLSLPYPSISQLNYEESHSYDSQNFVFSWDVNVGKMENYLTFLISHEETGQFEYNEKNISLPIPSSRQKALQVSLVSSSNTGEIFDTAFITGISTPPLITGFTIDKDTYYLPKFDEIIFQPKFLSEQNNISGYELYEKPTISHEINESLVDFKNLTDSYPLNQTFLKESKSSEILSNISVKSPASVKVASTGNFYSGILGTGYFTSGNIYNYKIVPFDYVGSGQPFSFDAIHDISNVTKVIRQDTDTTIVNVTNVTSEVTSVGSNLSGISGEVKLVSSNLSGVSGTLDVVNSDLFTVSGDVQSVSGNVNIVSGTVNSVVVDVNIVSGRTTVLPTGQQILSGNLNVTGNSHISGSLNVGRSEDNVLFSIDGSGSHINSNLEISGRLAVSGRVTIGGDPPTSSTNTGILGQIAFDSEYFYVCTGLNKWGRVEISNW